MFIDSFSFQKGKKDFCHEISDIISITRQFAKDVANINKYSVVVNDRFTTPGTTRLSQGLLSVDENMTAFHLIALVVGQRR